MFIKIYHICYYDISHINNSLGEMKYNKKHLNSKNIG